jgi:hypothetical protein
VNNYLHSTTIFRCAPCSRRTTPTSPPELRQRRWGFYEWIKVLPGLFIADVVPTFGMINMIGGECDR